MNHHPLRHLSWLSALAIACIFSLQGCGGGNDNAVEDAADSTGNAIEEGAEETGEAVEEGAEETGEAVEEVTE